MEAGASSLSQGTFSLSSGASSARNDASALASGTSQLSDGASTLSDSISTANDALSGIPMPEGAEEGSKESGNDEPTAGGLTLENSADESAPRIAIAINPAKNPMVTNSLESALTSLAGYGIEVDTTYTTGIPEELSTGYAHMPLLIITYLSSYAAGAAGAMLLKPFRRTRGRTALALLVQAMCALATALVIGAVATASFNAVLGAQVDFGSLALFLALCSFALQLVVVASLDLFGTPGMAVPLLLMGLCMLSAYLPYEFLPEFWQDCIYPYNPLRFMVDGFKSILYTDGGFINQATPLVANVAAVGAVLITLCLFKRPKEELGERMPAHLP